MGAETRACAIGHVRGRGHGVSVACAWVGAYMHPGLFGAKHPCNPPPPSTHPPLHTQTNLDTMDELLSSCPNAAAAFASEPSLAAVAAHRGSSGGRVAEDGVMNTGEWMAACGATARPAAGGAAASSGGGMVGGGGGGGVCYYTVQDQACGTVTHMAPEAMRKSKLDRPARGPWMHTINTMQCPVSEHVPTVLVPCLRASFCRPIHGLMLPGSIALNPRVLFACHGADARIDASADIFSFGIIMCEFRFHQDMCVSVQSLLAYLPAAPALSQQLIYSFVFFVPCRGDRVRPWQPALPQAATRRHPKGRDGRDAPRLH